ncbi:Uma2 family endonuclease [Hydrogenivirga sp.]
MRVARYIPHYTVEDYMKWQGDWELIEGVPVALASPKYIHQRIVTRLASIVEPQLEECKDCNLVVELDYIVSRDTVFRPDISIVCEEVEDYIRKAPLMIIEVVSESTAERDEGVKKEFYEQEGVEYYMLVYPEEKLAKVYRNSERGYRKMKDIKSEVLKLGLGECFLEIDFSKIWI